jgi:hypothetical protein
VLALALQALLADRLALAVTPVLLRSLVACLIGLADAKLYYLADHPNQPQGLMHMTSGMCIQVSSLPLSAPSSWGRASQIPGGLGSPGGHSYSTT